MSDLVRVTDEMRARHGQLLRTSPAYFGSHMLMGPREPPFNGRFTISHHHLEWDQLLTIKKNICVLASRNSGKSMFFSLCAPLFYASNQPGGSTFIISSTQDTVGMIMERIKAQVEDNPKLAYLMPAGKNKGKWNTTTVVFANGHQIVCASMNTKKRGFHPDNIIGDDILTDESAYSETTRRRQQDYWLAAVTPMLSTSAGGKIVVVGTPQSARDLLMGNLRTNPHYAFRTYPAERNGVPTWPAQLSAEFLADKRQEVGSIIYSKEYLCVPVSSASSLFPYEMFRGEPVEQYGVTLGMPRKHWEDAGMSIFMGVDIAMSSSVGADYTVITTIAIDSHGNIWIVDLQRVHGMPYHEQLALITSVGNKYKPAVIAVESNQAQRFVADELIRTTNLPVIRWVTTAAKHSLEHGLPSLKLLFENRKLRIPRGDAKSIEMTDIFTDEFNNFTFLNGRAMSAGEHDDMAMSFFMAVNATRLSTFSVSFGEDTVVATGKPVPLTRPEQMQADLLSSANKPVRELPNPFGSSF